MWEIIKPLLPVRDLRKGGGMRRYGDRLVLDSVFYVLRSGCQWRMLPRDLMPWDAAHRWFTKWRRDGTWDRVHDELRRRVRIGAGRDPQLAVEAEFTDQRDPGQALGGQLAGCGQGGAGDREVQAGAADVVLADAHLSFAGPGCARRPSPESAQCPSEP
ncbi:transposase [Streptomyces sp. NPDC057486]|uniref:transposase n=1 Tax=Streptomyces sp. NPDC057486 TaxID=3346145 RepID=UPI0036AD26FE